MKPIIVLETSGKHGCVDFAKVYLFSDKDEARIFCNAKNTGKKKYWTKLEIVNEGESVYLDQPDEAND